MTSYSSTHYRCTHTHVAMQSWYVNVMCKCQLVARLQDRVWVGSRPGYEVSMTNKHIEWPGRGVLCITFSTTNEYLYCIYCTAVCTIFESLQSKIHCTNEWKSD